MQKKKKAGESYIVMTESFGRAVDALDRYLCCIKCG